MPHQAPVGRVQHPFRQEHSRLPRIAVRPPAAPMNGDLNLFDAPFEFPLEIVRRGPQIALHPLPFHLAYFSHPPVLQHG